MSNETERPAKCPVCGGTHITVSHEGHKAIFICKDCGHAF